MNLIGGLGDIIPNMKNLPLFTTSPTERVSGTWHSNGRDIWILTHKNGNSEFYAYLVTPTGVNLTPVISNVGAVCQMQLHSLRISPNGKKVAMSHVNTSPPRAVEILDFNPANGVLSNPIYVSSAPGFSWQQPYGLEFSPDNSKVYITTWNGSSYLHQIDLAAGSPSAIIASIQTVYSHQFGMGHLTLGPNGKIYSSCTALGNVGKLISIENPNLAGTACNVLVYGVDLLGRVSGSSTPNTFPGFYRTFAPTIVGADTVCQSNVPFTYQATNVSANDSTSWELTTGITPSTLALDSANLVFTSLGTHRIVLHKWNACGYRTDSMDVTVVPGISISLGRDTALCTGGITLSPGPGYATYLWQNNSSASSLVATAPGTYWVEVNTMGGCRARDTIIVYGATGATVNLGPDISFCQGTVFNLNAGPGFANYFWQNGWTQQTFTGWVPGSYIVRATDHCGNVSRDTINVTANNPNLVNLGADSSVCDGSNYTLNAGNGFVSYLWQNGNTTPTMVTSQTGLYWVEVIDAQGCVDRDSISLTFATSAQPPNAAYSYSLAVWTANFTSGATGSAITYFWDFGDGGTSTLINPTHTFPGNGTYRVCLIVTDDCNRADTVCRNISVVYVGNEAIEEEISVLLYPNPSSGDLSVWFQSPENGTMKIISVIGREVVQEILYSGRINEFDFQSISTGVYIIEIESDGKKRVQKWVKE